MKYRIGFLLSLAILAGCETSGIVGFEGFGTYISTPSGSYRVQDHRDGNKLIVNPDLAGAGRMGEANYRKGEMLTRELKNRENAALQYMREKGRKCRLVETLEQVGPGAFYRFAC